MTGIFKRTLAVFLSLTIVFGCMGCAKENQQEQGDNMSNITSTPEATPEAINDNSLQDFAAGKPVEEETDTTDNSAEVTDGTDTEDASTEEAVLELNNEIEEKCPASAFIARSDVSYGKVEHNTYYSNTCGMERGFSILLPAGYSEDKEYPVLYMLHGIFGDEYSFTNDSSNKIKEIVGNMAADGYIEEMIVVFPNIYAKTDAAMQPGFSAEAIKPYDNFVNDLVNDLMPFIESNYSVKTGRENTLLAGFSMGGRETLYISHCYPELFGYVCAISPAPGLTPGEDWAMVHEGTITEDELVYASDAILHDVLMVCCGTKDSVVGTFPLSYHEIMERNGVDHIWYEITGADHDNNAIKSGVYNLLKQTAYSKAEAAKLAAEEAEKEANRAKVTLSLATKYYLEPNAECGTVQKISYMAHDYQGNGEDVEKFAYVYLPAGYDETKQYNVIYLMHGIGGTEAEWGLNNPASSRLKKILDNLIADGDIDPVIVVTPNGKAFALSQSSGNDLFYNFGLELRNDLIPYIDGHYATYAEYDENGYDLTASRTHRAIAGLSMGGMQTINIGICECLDLFSWFGAFSAAPTSYNASRVAATVDASEYTVDFFYNICGTGDSIAYASASAAAKNIELFGDSFKSGENFLWQEKSGGHDFNIWYLGIYNFALIAFYGEKACAE